MTAARPDEDAETDHALDYVEQCLPERLRSEWTVMPRRTVLQVFLLGLLMGSSVALYVVGKIFDVEALEWTLPIALVAPMIAVKIWPWWRGDRLNRQLIEAHREAPTSEPS